MRQRHLAFDRTSWPGQQTAAAAVHLQRAARKGGRVCVCGARVPGRGGVLAWPRAAAGELASRAARWAPPTPLGAAPCANPTRLQVRAAASSCETSPRRPAAVPLQTASTVNVHSLRKRVECAATGRRRAARGGRCMKYSQLLHSAAFENFPKSHLLGMGWLWSRVHARDRARSACMTCMSPVAESLTRLGSLDDETGRAGGSRTGRTAAHAGGGGHPAGTASGTTGDGTPAFTNGDSRRSTRSRLKIDRTCPSFSFSPSDKQWSSQALSQCIVHSPKWDGVRLHHSSTSAQKKTYIDTHTVFRPSPPARLPPPPRPHQNS